MSSYPSKLKQFRAWAKAMEQGAQVGNPDYSSSGKMSSTSGRKRRRKRRRRRKKQQEE